MSDKFQRYNTVSSAHPHQQTHDIHRAWFLLVLEKNEGVVLPTTQCKIGENQIIVASNIIKQ